MSYVLDEKWRRQLKVPMGELHVETQGLYTHLRQETSCLMTVGDICSYDCITEGVVPELVIYDFMRERKEIPGEMRGVLEGLDLKCTKVVNEAGTISDEAIGAIRQSLDGEGRAKIEVKGEEDLLALPCILFAPDGALVCYGQPGKGTVVIRIDDSIREKIRDIMKELEA